jgi:DNA-binding response OmpR family regulator
LKLLLVEDDETTVESLKLCLEICEPDSSIMATSQGILALALLKTDVFDAVLLDLGLPDIDGIEVIKRLRVFSRMPLIVISARHSSESVSQALELGADDYVTKPFDYRNLLKRLKILIDKNRPQ